MFVLLERNMIKIVIRVFLASLLIYFIMVNARSLVLLVAFLIGGYVNISVGTLVSIVNCVDLILDILNLGGSTFVILNVLKELELIGIDVFDYFLLLVLVCDYNIKSSKWS